MRGCCWGGGASRDRQPRKCREAEDSASLSGHGHGEALCPRG